MKTLWPNNSFPRSIPMSNVYQKISVKQLRATLFMITPKPEGT